MVNSIVVFMDPAEVIDLLWVVKFILLLFLSGFSGWFLTSSIKEDFNSRLALSILIGLHIIPLIALTHLNLTSLSFLIVLLVVTSFSYIYYLNSGFRYSVQAGANFSFTTVLIFIASTMIFLCLVSLLGLISHWDHILAPPVYVLDYARTGNPYSDWISTNLPGRWVLAQQTTSISLDAFEIIWFGTFTSILSKYIYFLGFFLTLALLPVKFRFFKLLFSIVLFVYFCEQLVAFRPHLYVGILLVNLLLLCRRFPHAKILPWLLLLFIVLAKRDGLIIAPLVAFVIVDNRFRLLAILLGVPLVLFASFYAEIGGESVGSILYQTIAKPKIWWETFKILSFNTFYLPLFLTALIGLIVRKDKELTRIFSIILVLSSAIFISAMLLVSEQRFNSGTIERKIIYFLYPVVFLFLVEVVSSRYVQHVSFLDFFLNIKSRITNFFQIIFLSEKRRFTFLGFSAYIKASFVTTIISILLVCLCTSTFRMASGLKYTYENTKGWSESVVDVVTLYRELLPLETGLKVGFFYEGLESFRRAPISGPDLYKFPFLQAFNGEDLVISDNPSLLTGRDVVFLSHEVDEKKAIILKKETNLEIYQMYGGMKVLLSNDGYLKFNKRYLIESQSGDSLVNFLKKIHLTELLVDWTEGGHISYYTQWNPELYQYKIVWPQEQESWSQPAYFVVQNSNKNYIHSISLLPHFMGDVLPTKIDVEVSSRVTTYSIADLDLGGTFFILVDGTGSVTIKMYSDENPSSFWKAPYFSIFNLTAHIVCESETCSLD